MNPTDSRDQNQDNRVKEDNPTFNQDKMYMDVSDRVTAQLDDEGYITFYMDQQKVGRYKMNEQTDQYEFAEEFNVSEAYKEKHPSKSPAEKPQSYVDGCDMGWC
ncbi:DUF2553 family protein [Alteribacter aurantiacus]|uniref:DUF2553 family protein n=1 Tax=Alteribacter aurantiacus TaxID=254410 RepID=UPI0003FE0567|nr:DUF2553 family protein [Alteribacter aurantiacus]